MIRRRRSISSVNRLYRILMEPTGAGGGGGGNTDPPAPTTTPPADTGAAERAFNAALSKHNNDGVALARIAFGEAESLRSKLAEATAQIPAKDSRVLTAQQAADLEAYNALGFTPKDLKGRLDKATELETADAARESQRATEQIAKAHGFDPEVLAMAPGYDALDIEMKKHVRQGKEVESAMVTPKGPDGKPLAAIPLDEYAEKNWTKLLPSLKAGDPDQPAKPPGSPIPGRKIVSKQHDHKINDEAFSKRPRYRF